jgi:hypothetical protein
MKLTTMHTYQSVRFNKKDETHFDCRKPNMEGLQMEYVVDGGYARIFIPGVDEVIVFPTNISYAVVDKESDKKKK